MSTAQRVVPCLESPMLTDARDAAERVMILMNQLLETPGLASAAMLQKLNYNMHQAESACKEAFATIVAG